MKIENLFVKYIKLRNKLNEGKIYKIVDNTNDNVYIGSTCNSLKTRLSKHKNSYKRFLNGLFHNIKSFDILKNNDYKIELLEKCDIKTKDELLARERFFIENNECLNKIIPGRSRKEYKIANKNKIDDYHKDYYNDNKEKLIKSQKEYYNDNKEKAKDYYIRNKEKLEEKFVCQCGGKYTHTNKSIHIRTIKHLNFLECLK